jgi:hypothetical protein
MSSDNPYLPAGSDGPGRPDDQVADHPDYLGEPEPRPRRRRPLLLTAAAVAVVGVVGAGAWGVAQLVGGGPEPAAAVPSDALGYLAVDLDPSAAQKVEALRTLRKFPALKEQLDLGSRDDVREWVFEQIQAEGHCEDLTFDDVESWLGYRVGVAAVPAADGGTEPDAVFVVQVDDADAARAGSEELIACSDGGDRPGRAFVDDFMVLAETQEIADQVAVDATSAPLADDAGFQRWMDEAGDPGIITGYVSADLPDVIADGLESGSTDDWLTTPGLAQSAAYSGSETPSPSEQADELRKALADFEGAAAVVRFDDGAVEAEVVAQGLPGQDVTSTGDSGIQQLPASTVLAVGVSLGDGWADRLLEQMRTSLGDEADVDQMLAELESKTGLELPEDAERLLGDGVSLAVDSRLDASALTAGGSPDPADLPLGLRINGNPDEVTPVLDKLAALLGPQVGESLVVEEGDAAVAVGVDPDYVKTLAGDGGLGDDESFTGVIPEAGDAGGALFVDFDEGGWLDDLTAEVDDPDAAETAANLRPLAALGASGWMDGDIAHGLLTLTTD